jgi:hypothetical protein
MFSSAKHSTSKNTRAGTFVFRHHQRLPITDGGDMGELQRGLQRCDGWKTQRQNLNLSVARHQVPSDTLSPCFDTVSSDTVVPGKNLEKQN